MLAGTFQGNCGEVTCRPPYTRKQFLGNGQCRCVDPNWRGPGVDRLYSGGPVSYSPSRTPYAASRMNTFPLPWDRPGVGMHGFRDFLNTPIATGVITVGVILGGIWAYKKFIK